MNYLQICQMTAQQTGTIQGVLPTTVIGQANRLKLVVDLVREAYLDIQNAHRKWRWLNSRFVGLTVADQRFYTYDSPDFLDERDSVPITRFSQWIFEQSGSDQGLSVYKTADGPQSEGAMHFLDVDRFYETQGRGVHQPGKPNFYTVDNQNRLTISPLPDDVYTLRGKYRKSPQYLLADADIPEMPVDFHTIIKDAALSYVEGFDEGPRIPLVRLRMLPNFSMLEAHQLPRVTWGAPLA